MPIEFRCQQCEQMLRVPDDSAGKNARCPKCQSLMTVPAAATGSPSEPEATGFAPQSPLTNPPPFVPAAFTSKPANPFSDGGPANPFAPAGPSGKPLSENPYAAPDAVIGGGYAFAPTNPFRSGLPWETLPRSLGVWWKTAGLVMSSPSQAFSRMRQEGNLMEPILYNIYALGQFMVVVLGLIGVVGGVLVLVDNNGNPGEKILGLAIAGVMMLFFGMLYVLLGATLGMMFSAAIYHVCLLLVGGARRGYETTFRVTSYGTNSLIWLFAIPYIGGLIGGIWMLVLLIVGLSKAHEISTGKAALAVLLPLIVCCVGYAMLIVLALAINPQ